MVKTITSILVAVAILCCGAIYESNFIKRQFNEFSNVLDVVYEKVENEKATENDMYSLQQNWIDKKRVLHAFIPHNEIKEIELWLSESIKLVREEKWEDALSKIEVLKTLSIEIPKTFSPSIENIL